MGVFYDVKLSGECDSRPQWRMPTLRGEHLKRLLEIARSRFPVEEVDNNEIPEGDLYFLFDASRPGNQAAILKPFYGMSKTVKTFMLWKDEESMMHRRKNGKMGISSFRQHEQLYMVSAPGPLALKPCKFPNYRGSTSGSMMGPIILPAMEAT